MPESDKKYIQESLAHMQDKIESIENSFTYLPGKKQTIEYKGVKHQENHNRFVYNNLCFLKYTFPDENEQKFLVIEAFVGIEKKSQQLKVTNKMVIQAWVVTAIFMAIIILIEVFL